VPVNDTKAVPVFEQKGEPGYDSNAEGGVVTVTTTLPNLSDAIDAQLAVFNVLMEYVLVAKGLTLTTIVGAVPLKAVPSDKVPLIVPVPVTVKVKLALPPLQITVVPLNTAVALEFTVTVALPVLSAAIDTHVPLVKVAMV
jgi:hypothetical protein